MKIDRFDLYIDRSFLKKETEFVQIKEIRTNVRFRRSTWRRRIGCFPRCERSKVKKEAKTTANERKQKGKRRDTEPNGGSWGN